MESLYYDNREGGGGGGGGGGGVIYTFCPLFIHAPSRSSLGEILASNSASIPVRPSATSLAGRRYSLSGASFKSEGGPVCVVDVVVVVVVVVVGIISSSSLTPDEDCHLRWNRLNIFCVLLVLGTGLLDPECTDIEGGRERSGVR